MTSTATPVSFENHSTTTQPKGPKTGRGARQRRSGGRNRAEAGLAVQHDQCRCDAGTRVPDPDLSAGFADQFGRTLWYTIEGTGGPVTIDTAGSAIDTLIGVFVPTDAGFEEIACIDDVEFEPVGATFQAALTIDTEVGVTYYVEVGGFFPFFEEATAAEKGRIRIRVR